MRAAGGPQPQMGVGQILSPRALWTGLMGRPTPEAAIHRCGIVTSPRQVAICAGSVGRPPATTLPPHPREGTLRRLAHASEAPPLVERCVTATSGS